MENKSPGLTQIKKLLSLLFALLLLSNTTFSQVDDFNQAQNDQNGAGAPYNISWVNGILNATHTAYFEGVGIPQRLIFTNLPTTTGNVHTLKFEHLTVAGGKHAYDFLMSWQQAQATAADHGNGTVNELQRLFTDQCAGAASADGLATCSALSGFSSSDDPNAVSSRYRRPLLPDMTDPSIGGNVQGKINCFEGIYGNRYIEIFGNQNISSASITFDGYKPGTDLAQYTITWTSASDKIMIRFAGRAAKGPGSCGYGSGLGAGSISGGNYHFKLSSIDGTQTGSQDNQLMAGAIPEPPDCGIEPGKLACPNTPSLTFNYTGSTTGVSLVWSFLNNTANAVIQNTTANPTVTIVPGPGGFTPGGSFQLHLAVTKDGVTTECDQTTPSTIQNVAAQATAVPTEIVLTAASQSSQLNARVSLDGGTTYLTDAQADAQFTFSWTKNPPLPNGGTLSSTTIRNPVFTAVAPAQTHTFTVTATQIAAPNCSATAQVIVDVSSGIPPCPNISGPTPVCEGSTGHVYTAAGSIPANTTYTWSIASGDATITSSPVVNVNSVTVTAGTTNYVVRLTMSFANTAITPIHCDYPVTVDEEPDADAGPDQRLCDATSVTLAATNPAVGTGTWTKVSGPAATITSPNAYNSTVTGLTPGTYVFRWTVVNGTCDDYDEVQIIIDDLIEANAGPDQALCAATSVTLAGNNPSPGTGTWTKVSGPAATITSPNLYNTTVTGLTAGTYVFRWTIVNGVCTDYDEVQIIIYSDVAPYAGPDQRLCDATSVTLAATNPAVGTGTWTKVSGPAATITSPNAYNSTVTGLTPGTYVFRWTVVNGECTAHDDVQIIIDAPVDANAGPDQTLCAATSTTLAGNNPSIGTGTWTQTGGAAATITSPNAYNTTVTGLTTGTYTFRWTIVNGTCSDWDEVQVTIYPNPTCTISGATTVCSASSNTYTGPAGMDSYAWSFDGAANGATFAGGITNTQSVTVIAGSGNYTLKLVVTDNGCSSTCYYPVTVTPCAETICTYTQGAYGNEGGKSCTPAGQLTTFNTIKFALGNWPGDQLVIGSAARSLTIRQSSDDDINAVMTYLPGGGGSATLQWNDGNHYIGAPNAIPSSMLKNGRFNNTLLSQTLTLGLNLGITTALGNLELRTDKKLVTATPVESCNTASSEFKCPYASYALTSSNVIQFLYNHYWNAGAFAPDLSGNKKATVMELFQLASHALGSTPGTTSVYGQPFGSIASLADQLNNIFDECQVFIGYMSETEFNTFNEACIYLTQESRGIVPEVSTELKVAAYPNPYNSTINFNFTSPVSGKAQLEVYDLVGKRIAVVFEGTVDAGMQKVVNYKVNALQRVPMIYRLTVGDKTNFGKLLPGNTD